MNPLQSKQPILLIPSYKPDLHLIDYLQSFRSQATNPVIVVDDGNEDQDSIDLFQKIDTIEGVKVIHHPHNMGKGQALKSGFQYFLENYPESIGLVTADADGQHAISDVLKVMQALEAQPHHLVLGVRDFTQAGIPARSRYGNQFTSALFHLIMGVKVKDTQTGLRGLSRDEALQALRIPGQRFEYEMKYLLDASHRKVGMTMVDIQTIYIENNASSHFSPIKDSLVIMASLFSYLTVSVGSALLDFLLFWIFWWTLFSGQVQGLVWDSVLARICSGLVNYWLNANWVFGSKPSSKNLFQYLLLFLVIMASSTFLISWIGRMTKSVLLWKILIDLGLALAFYLIQQRIIFKKSQKEVQFV